MQPPEAPQDPPPGAAPLAGPGAPSEGTDAAAGRPRGPGAESTIPGPAHRPAVAVLCGKPELSWIESERWAGLVAWLCLALSSGAGLAYSLWIDRQEWAPAAAPAVALALAALGAWFWARPPKLHARLSYRLDEQGLAIESGRLWRRWTFVPRQRVQFVDLISGPIDQRFGLADLVLHTAGSEAAEIRLPGLSLEVAERLRAELLSGLEREAR